MGCGAEPREENFSVFGANLNIFEGASAQTTYNKIDRPLPKKLKESSVSRSPQQEQPRPHVPTQSLRVSQSISA